MSTNGPHYDQKAKKYYYVVNGDYVWADEYLSGSSSATNPLASGSSSSLEDGGPHWDEYQRPYWIVQGQRVYNSAHTGSSSGEFVGSVGSAYQTGTTPQAPASWPPTTPHSQLHNTMTRGYHPPTYNTSGNSQSSAPADPNADPYRQAMDPKLYPRGPPLNSTFSHDYSDYKSADEAGYAAAETYADYASKATKYSKKKRQQLQQEGINLVGNPPATQEWHGTAANYASHAEGSLRGAAGLRQNMGRNYIGYDTQSGARGHDERTDILGRKADKMGEKYQSHSRWQ